MAHEKKTHTHHNSCLPFSTTMSKISVVKRSGQKELVVLDKIQQRISNLSTELHGVDVGLLSTKVVAGIFDGVTTLELDELAARQAAGLGFSHPDYLKLAARIKITALWKVVPPTFSEAMIQLSRAKNKLGEPAPLVDAALVTFVQEHTDVIDAMVNAVRDRELDLTYFGVCTLERAYLLRLPDKSIIECPTYMWARVALGISSRDKGSFDLDIARTLLDMFSKRVCTMATPCLFNAGTPRPQLSSCFLSHMKDDSISGIFQSLQECAEISKYSGGIGLSIHNVRASGSYIRGTGGRSNGIVPMLRCFNNCARYVDQGGGKRKGSFAIYLEPWHADIVDFLQLRKNNGEDELRCRDLFLSLWIPDLFMKRVKSGGDWSLMCPNECPGLSDVWGDEFETLYTKYESENRARQTMKARDLWAEILQSQIETGTPYMVYKDHCNKFSNQQNVGTIKSSNLCAEIVEFSSPEETAVCNLASMVLGQFADESSKEFDFEGLEAAVAVVTRALDRVIDVNFYPIEAARRSNARHRPVGLGIQGLSDVFLKLQIAFCSQEAVDLSARIMETMYYSALKTSNELAQELGSYSTFSGSPASQGQLQFDLREKTNVVYTKGRYGKQKWDALKQSIVGSGLRNSLLIALMPTASTSQICGSVCESFEPLTSNLSTRRTLAGEFTCVNPWLIQELESLGQWNQETLNLLARDKGSAQRLPLSEESKKRYLTAYEMSQKFLIDHASARQDFCCQSQSLNLYVSQKMLESGAQKISSMHMYGWERAKLKTGIYYTRTRPQNNTSQFTVNVDEAEALAKTYAQQRPTCDEETECLMCGS